MTKLDIHTKTRSYPIYIGQDMLMSNELLNRVPSEQVCIISNPTIAPYYLEKLTDTLPSKHVESILIPDGEEAKNLQNLGMIFDEMIHKQQRRNTTLIALGGGVVGDITGFAAACYQRGIDYIQVPTTLLAQIDSSVGGKTAVNHAGGKNMIGAFHQPSAVFIDTNTLDTLPKREFRSGLAEMFKYALIHDLKFLTWIEDNIEALLNLDKLALEQSIARCCQSKAEFVRLDEHDHNVRMALNFGHTFAHALETNLGLGQWLHGEAVGVGMLMACELSEQVFSLTLSLRERLTALLKKCELPTKLPEHIKIETFLNNMRLDKKRDGKDLRLVLLKAPENAIVLDYSEYNILQNIIAKYT